MILDYNSNTGAYFLRLPRSEGNPQEFMTEYGLDLSVPATTAREAVLFTYEPYAAASFGKYATPAARAQLGGILEAIDASWKDTSGIHVELPPDKELWPFQLADIEYARSRKHVLVGDEPGLGKTPIAIGFANDIQARRVLVICPASIRFQWVRRIKEWSTMPRGRVYPIISSKGGVHPKAEWTVISWELARSPGIHRALMAGKYDLLIADEAHYAKNISSKRSRAVFGYYDERESLDEDQITEGLAERCEIVMALSGTPLPNRPREAYVLSRALCFDAIDWMAEKPFRERFNPSKQGTNPETGKLYVDERIGRTGELQNRLRANYMTRHLKRQVMTQLKLPVYDLIQVQETAAVKQALDVERLLDIDPEDLEGADAAILGYIATARRLMGLAIAPQAAEYVKMLIEGGEEKLVLFACHIQVLDMFVDALHSYGIVRIDGKDSARSKDAKVQTFIQDPKCRVCLGNVLSLGTGTDGLQHVSNHALIVEPDWTPGNNIQCFDRLDRGGQTRTVQGDIFVAPNSIAEKVLASALRKGQVIHKALDRRVA